MLLRYAPKMAEPSEAGEVAGPAGSAVVSEAAVAKPEPVPGIALAAVTAPAASPPAEPVAEKPAALDLSGLQKQLADLESARAKDSAELAELRAARQGDAEALRVARLDNLLDAVKVEPAYREFARAQLASADPTTDAGKAAVDAFAAKHPAMVARMATAAVDPSIEQWMAERAKAAPGSAWSFLSPSMLAKVTVD